MPSVISGENLLATATSCGYPRIASFLLTLDIKYNYIGIDLSIPMYTHPKLVLPMLRKKINPFIISYHGSSFQCYNWCFQKKILQDYYTRHEIKEIIKLLSTFSNEFNETMLLWTDCTMILMTKCIYLNRLKNNDLITF